MSGQGCAGLCGPRHRWEEEEHEKTLSIYSDGAIEDVDALHWSWRTCTRLRVQEAFDFCLTVKPPARWSTTIAKKDEAEGAELPGVQTAPAFEVEQVLAAVGLPSVPAPSRRGVLSEDLFARPRMGDDTGAAPSPAPELSDIIPKVVKRSSGDREVAGPSAPLMKLPYPFAGYGAQASSKDQIPFPPSPGSRKEKHRSPASTASERQRSSAADQAEEAAREEEVDEEEAEEEEDEVEEMEESSEAHPRTSGSMSSLGQPITSRYPFQFRRPHARGASLSSSAMTHSTPKSETSPSSNSRSALSRSTQSTGNQDTSSESMSQVMSSSGMSSPTSGYGSPIPMPPRHPQPGRGRARAGTMPVFPSSPSPVVFPGRIPPRMRTDSENTDHIPGGYESFLSEDADEEEDAEEEPQMMEQPEPEGPHEAAEGEDSVGLLGVPQRSPRSSNVSSRRRRGRRSDQSSSQSRSNSVSSRSRAGSAVRSRTQSLIQSLGNASRSSVELVQSMRTRANSSRARLEEDNLDTSDSRSRSGSASHASSSHENYTFGQPMLSPMRRASSQGFRPTASTVSVSAPSEATTSRLTARQESRSREREEGTGQRAGIAIPQRSDESRPDISTAAQSFITAPATIAGTSDSSDPVPSTWVDTSHMVDRPDAQLRLA